MFNKHCSQLAKVSRGEQWLLVHKEREQARKATVFNCFTNNTSERTGIVSQIKIQA